MKLRTLLGGLAAVSVVLVAGRADAAAATPCTVATMSPVVTTVPSNLPGFAYTALAATAADVHLYGTTGGAKTELPVTLGPAEGGFLPVKPAAPLTSGASYQLEFKAFCDYGPVPAQAPIAFTVTDAAPLPTKLGDALAAPVVTLKDLGTTQYTVTGSWALDAAMKPWLGAYQLVVVVDGIVSETKATVAPAQDKVQISATGWCDATTAATKHHTVLLRGRLALAPAVDSAGTSLDFDCPAPRFSTPPNVAPTPPEPTAPGGVTNPGTTVRSGGCAVTRSPQAVGASPLLFGLAAALALTFRTRARRAVTGRTAASRRT
jgi:hypothetical protein